MMPELLLAQRCTTFFPILASCIPTLLTPLQPSLGCGARCSACALLLVWLSLSAAMQTLRLNGMNPICKPRRIKLHTPLPPQKPAASLFSPPQPAEVKCAPGLDGNGPAGSGPVIRHARDAENQRLYNVSWPFAASPMHWQTY